MTHEAPAWANDESIPPPKSEWPPGVWHDEPDQAVIGAGVVRGAIERNMRHGQLNGYLVLGPTHPWFHGEIPEEVHYETHGGITWDEVQEDGSRWVGFDCGHHQDYQPAFHLRMMYYYEHVFEKQDRLDYDIWAEGPNPYDRVGNVYRKWEYVQERVEAMMALATAALLALN